MKIYTTDMQEIELHTGDEILCSGRSRMSRAIIFYNKIMGMRGPAAEISHVAKFIDRQVFEATVLNKWCNKKGYQRNSFQEWYANYDGMIWIRQTEGCEIDETQYTIDACKMIGTPYESGIPGVMELLLTFVAVKWKLLREWAREHLRTKNIHCSESNVLLSQQAGYVSGGIRANKTPPCEFWDGELYEKAFTKGRLKKAVRIK